MNKKVLTQNLSEPLDGATTAKVAINMVDGNLTLDGATSGEPLLTSGTLQYLEYQSLPTQSVNKNNGQTTFTLKASGKGQPWFHFPRTAYNGAIEWQIHLNPTVLFDITAHTGGGNVNLNLTDIAVTCVTADTGGGNMEVILPDNAAGLIVAVKTGAGSVVVHVPVTIAARIHATSGLGKVIVASRFNRIDGNTYQSPDYNNDVDKVEITVQSGAGNVSVKEKIVDHELVTN